VAAPSVHEEFIVPSVLRAKYKVPQNSFFGRAEFALSLLSFAPYAVVVPVGGSGPFTLATPLPGVTLTSASVVDTSACPSASSEDCQQTFNVSLEFTDDASYQVCSYGMSIALVR
jgi:hypothetical protein